MRTAPKWRRSAQRSSAGCVSKLGKVEGAGAAEAMCRRRSAGGGAHGVCGAGARRTECRCSVCRCGSAASAAKSGAGCVSAVVAKRARSAVVRRAGAGAAREDVPRARVEPEDADVLRDGCAVAREERVELREGLALVERGPCLAHEVRVLRGARERVHGGVERGAGVRRGLAAEGDGERVEEVCAREGAPEAADGAAREQGAFVPGRGVRARGAQVLEYLVDEFGREGREGGHGGGRWRVGEGEDAGGSRTTLLYICIPCMA